MARIVGQPNAEDVKRVAAAALVAALDDGKEQARKKPGLTGMRAVATGAVLYTAGKAAFSGRRFINERLRGEDDVPEDDEEEFDEDEPEAEEDEDFEDEEDEDFEEDEELEEEPVAEEDEDFEEDEELEEEPVAEEDDDLEEDEYADDDDERSVASEPPVHPDEDDDAEVDDPDLPSRPSRKRTPVGRR